MAVTLAIFVLIVSTIAASLKSKRMQLLLISCILSLNFLAFHLLFSIYKFPIFLIVLMDIISAFIVLKISEDYRCPVGKLVSLTYGVMLLGHSIFSLAWCLTEVNLAFYSLALDVLYITQLFTVVVGAFFYGRISRGYNIIKSVFNPTKKGIIK